MNIISAFSWKGKIPEGKINQSLVSLTDIFATLADAAAVPLERSEATDSENLLPCWLKNSEHNTHRIKPLVTLGGQAIPLENPQGEGGNDWLSIRNGDKKLTVNKANFQTGEAEPVGLYDFGYSIKESPNTNFLNSIEYRPVLDSLIGNLNSVIKENWE